MKYPDEQSLMEQLTQILKIHQYFLIPGLKSREVAHELGIPEYKLARLLQKRANCNFNDYINRIRVDFACRMMSEPETRNLPLTELSEYAGFGSRSVFYDAFKKVKGLNPGEFKMG